MEARKRSGAELLLEAQRTWGWLAKRHGLGIVDADERTISVELNIERPTRAILISKMVLEYVRDTNWPFKEAAHRLEHGT